MPFVVKSPNRGRHKGLIATRRRRQGPQWRMRHEIIHQVCRRGSSHRPRLAQETTGNGGTPQDSGSAAMTARYVNRLRPDNDGEMDS